MKPAADLASDSIRAFCAGDFRTLKSLLAADVRISGPLGEFASSAAYLGDLALDLPARCGYTILSITENGDCVSVFWRYEKPGKPLLIGQLFRICNGRITDILLIFDTKNFESDSKDGSDT